MFLFNVGIVYPYVDCFLEGPGQALVLPHYDVKIVGSRDVSCLLDVHMYGGRLLEMFLIPLTQGP